MADTVAEAICSLVELAQWRETFQGREWRSHCTSDRQIQRCTLAGNN